MKIFLITDTHFNHHKLIEYGRDPDFEKRVWQGLYDIPDGSLLIHLGDICIGNDEAVHERLAWLKLKKILVRGNHDRKSDKWYLEHGWDMVVDNFSGHYFGRYITFSHIPIAGVQNWNIHGHFHNSKHRSEEPGIKSYYNPNLHKLLAIEYTAYQPVELEKFLQTVKDFSYEK